MSQENNTEWIAVYSPYGYLCADKIALEKENNLIKVKNEKDSLYGSINVQIILRILG